MQDISYGLDLVPAKAPRYFLGMRWSSEIAGLLGNLNFYLKMRVLRGGFSAWVDGEIGLGSGGAE